jgi:hypothetical protein
VKLAEARPKHQAVTKLYPAIAAMAEAADSIAGAHHRNMGTVLAATSAFVIAAASFYNLERIGILVGAAPQRTLPLNLWRIRDVASGTPAQRAIKGVCFPPSRATIGAAALLLFGGEPRSRRGPTGKTRTVALKDLLLSGYSKQVGFDPADGKNYLAIKARRRVR